MHRLDNKITVCAKRHLTLHNMLIEDMTFDKIISINKSICF